MTEPHTIGGGSAYDADMTLIESFVRYQNRVHKHDGELTSIAVHTYYCSQLLNYWSHFKAEILPNLKTQDFSKIPSSNIYFKDMAAYYNERAHKREKIYSDFKHRTYDKEELISLGFTNLEDVDQSSYELPLSGETVDLIQKHVFDRTWRFSEPVLIEEDFLAKLGSILDNKLFIQQNIHKYEERFLRYYNILNKDFNKVKYVNLAAIEFLFIFIGLLACGNPLNEIILFRNRNRFPTYMLPNNTGLFGLNTYLYAFFSEVFLIGVPNDVASFDGITDCPYEFMDHDHNHLSLQMYMLEDRSKFETLKRIYYRIHNSNYNKREKELLILALWICVHEELIDIVEITPEDYYSLITQSEGAYIEEFYSEFLSFADILDSEDIKTQVIKEFPMISEGVPAERYYFTMIMMYGYIELRNLWNSI